MTHQNQFKTFWDLYPSRNNKKVGRYACELWFEAKGLNEATFQTIIDWIIIDNDNRSRLQNEFYANPCDPIRFLRERMWRDDIKPAKPKFRVINGKSCGRCGQPAVHKSTGGEYDHYYCKEHRPRKVNNG